MEPVLWQGAHKLQAADLEPSPAWFPLETVDPRTLGFLWLDEVAYRAASFLDQRLLRPEAVRGTLGLEPAQQIAARLPVRLHYIFHTGHVGSTLISRLIGAQRAFFALREPALLRAAALRPAPGDAGVPAVPELRDTVALLSRTWRAEQRAVVKVTSFVNELAGELLACSERARTVFVYVEPVIYIQSILAGPNSRIEARTLAPLRLRRLVRRLCAPDWRADPSGEGELIAMSWLCEVLSFYQSCSKSAVRALWMDFDAFLREPAASLLTIGRALGSEPAPSEIEALVRGPIMQRYSKAPEFAYDAGLRRELLQGAAASSGDQITRGLRWLESIAHQYQPAAAALEFAQRGARGGAAGIHT